MRGGANIINQPLESQLVSPKNGGILWISICLHCFEYWLSTQTMSSLTLDGS